MTVSETALDHFSGYGGTKSDFVSNYPVAIDALLTTQLIGTLLNIYLVRISNSLFSISRTNVENYK